MIRAIILDLDNTLTDFMRMKTVSIEAAVEDMIDAIVPTITENSSSQR